MAKNISLKSIFLAAISAMLVLTHAKVEQIHSTRAVQQAVSLNKT